MEISDFDVDKQIGRAALGLIPINLQSEQAALVVMFQILNTKYDLRKMIDQGGVS